MIPSRIRRQRWITRKSWDEIMASIKQSWAEDFYITDFDYGQGMYRLVMSQGTGWSDQTIFFGSEFPEEKVQKYWGLGFHITNVMHDGSDWIVVMSVVPEKVTQAWFTNPSWDGFKEKIREYWGKGMVVSKIACKLGSTPEYCGIVTKYPSGRQQWAQYFPGGATTQQLVDLCEDGTMITDIYDVDGGVFAITCSNTGWSEQTVCVRSDWNGVTQAVDKYWNEGFEITTISFYQNQWYVILSR